MYLYEITKCAVGPRPKLLSNNLFVFYRKINKDFFSKSRTFLTDKVEDSRKVGRIYQLIKIDFFC